MPKPPFSLFYASVDHAISIIKVAGRGAWLAKADITDAFKVLPVHPSDWHLLGAMWDGFLYFAVRLTFGCRSTVLSEVLCWILLNVSRLPAVLHPLDFLLVDPHSPSPGSSLAKLRQLFLFLTKRQSAQPRRSNSWGLHSIQSRWSPLPADKFPLIHKVSRAFASESAVSKRQLLSLLGHLNFAMRIIPQGRSFISRLLDLANSVPSLLDSVILDDGCCSDLAFWSKLLSDWNGISFLYDDVILSANSLQFFTDTVPSSVFCFFLKVNGSPESGPPHFPSPSPRPSTK